MFHIRERQSTVGREVLGGLTTFMAMSYIIFVQVSFLSGPSVGMDPGGVMMATCLASAIACILMGIWANYPIGLAPGMGENVYFAFTLVPLMATWGYGAGWKMALALTATAGAVFLLLSLVSFRARLLNAIPDSLKSGIAAGIGLFIAVVGLNMGNVVAKNPYGPMTSLVGFRDNPAAWLTLAGLAIIMMLTAFRVRGAILLGILSTTAIAMLWGHTQLQVPVAMPTGLTKTAGGFIGGFASLYQGLSEHWVEILTALFILLFMDLFDTVGTLVGVSQRAGLMQNGKLPRAERALAADAGGTLGGAMLGTSTVTSYIESITGVQAGARTGLAAIVVGICMLAAMFFRPLVEMVIGDFTVTVAGSEVQKFPTIAPALIVVGALMMRTMRDIEWDEITESIPAFLTMITIPLAYSIADGIAIGFIAYAAGKLLVGRPRECPLLVYLFAILLSLRFLLPGING